MGRRGFIAYDPEITKEHFNSDVVTGIYYFKLLRYDEFLDKDPEGFFTVKGESIQSSTCITRRQQERARKWLVSNRYVTTCVRVPAGKTSPQVHYRIDRKLN